VFVAEFVFLDGEAKVNCSVHPHEFYRQKTVWFARETPSFDTRSCTKVGAGMRYSVGVVDLNRFLAFERGEKQGYADTVSSFPAAALIEVAMASSVTV